MLAARPQKITFGEMREMGVRGVLIYCADYRCGHSVALSADRWADDVRLSHIEPHFTYSACGRRGPSRHPARLPLEDRCYGLSMKKKSRLRVNGQNRGLNNSA
jgi:hypothetical protein